ncbi:DUF86 domain-containing protein [Anaerolineae bacterium CFX9]|nr:DUF86 domain-containing protein [Anaerolineae bacterium CFX9]
MSHQIRYLREILSFIERIQNYTAAGEHEFFPSTLVQDAVIRNLELIGEIARNRLNEQTKDLAPETPWRAIADFRNLLIHMYDQVNLDIVWNTVQVQLPLLKSTVEKLISNLPESDTQ